MISGTDQREIYQISSRRPEDQTGNGRPENQEKTGFKPMILYIFFDTLYQLHILRAVSDPDQQKMKAPWTRNRKQIRKRKRKDNKPDDHESPKKGSWAADVVVLVFWSCLPDHGGLILLNGRKWKKNSEKVNVYAGFLLIHHNFTDMMLMYLSLLMGQSGGRRMEEGDTRREEAGAPRADPRSLFLPPCV